MSYGYVFRLELSPAELGDFDRPSALARARHLARQYPGIELVDVRRATTGIDITVVQADRDPAGDIVADLLHRALRLSPNQDRRFRQVRRKRMSDPGGWAGVGDNTRLPGEPARQSAPPMDREAAPPILREKAPAILDEPAQARAEPSRARPPATSYAPDTGAGHHDQSSGRGVRSGPPRQRYMRGQCADMVQTGKTLSLLVRIAVSAGGAELKSFHVPAEGLGVLLVVHAPGMRVLGDERQTLRVPAEGDSDPCMFELVADSPGARRISVTAWQGGNYLGELLIEVTAVRDVPGSSPRNWHAELSPDTVDGAVTLEVRYDPSTKAYRFQFRDIDNPREEPHALSYDPGPLVEDLVNDLDNLAQGQTGYSAAETRDYLMDAGARLWQRLLPQRVREQFWERQHRIRQLTIIADTDTVPWELLYPMDPGHDAGFLVEQFPVTRDVFERPPLVRSLQLHPARFVRGQDSLDAAGPEIAVLSRLVGAGDSPPTVLTQFTPVRQLITTGGFGLLHFACHNSFSLAGGSSISLDNRPFTATNMEAARINRSLRASAPLIFINACRTAGRAATYNGLDGWADAFMQAGAGAFVGSLWAVTDGAAREFAEEFYRELQAGRPLGEAVTAARRSAARQPGDPTWLAYTVYGDPRATLAPR